MLRAAALLLLFLPFQDAEVRALIEKLKSDEIVVREEAYKKLKALGEAAAPELEKAAKGADADVARRAESLLKLLRIRRELSPNLQAVAPDLAERLAFREDHTWTEAFLEILEWRDARWLKLRRGDIDALAPRAWEYAAVADRQSVYAAITSHRLRSAVPALLKNMEVTFPFLRKWDLENLDFREAALPALTNLLKHADARTRELAILRLAWAGGADKWEAVIPLLEHPVGEVRVSAARYFLDTSPRPEAVPGLLKLIEGPGSLEKTYAIRALAKLAPAEALPVILKLKDHKRDSVRELVADELSAYPVEAAAPTVLELLKDPKGDIRAAAAGTLGHWKLKSAFDNVLPLLSDSDSGSRRKAAQALLEFDRDRALPLVRKMLDDSKEDLKITGVGALAWIGDTPSIPAIAALLEHPKSDVRIAAIEALGGMKAVAHGAAIARRLETAEPSEAGVCREVLEDLKSPESYPVLMRLLEMPDLKNLGRTIRTASYLQVASAGPALVKLLKHEKTEVAVEAALALGHVQARASIPELRELLKDPEFELRSAALTSLGRLRAVEARGDIVPFLKKPEKGEDDLVGDAIDALGDLKLKESVPDLLPFLDICEHRERAFQALSDINDPSAFPAMLKLFDDVDYSTRVKAIRRFGELKAASAVPSLLLALKDEDHDIRAFSLRSLGLIGTPEAIKGLNSGLADRKPLCRMRSMAWLREHDAMAAVPLILPLLKDADPEVRLMAADTLGWLGSREGAKASLEGGESITGLNFLRRPEATRKLKRVRLKEPPEGIPEVLLALFAKAGVVAGTLKPAVTPPQAEWLRERQAMTPVGEDENLIQLLDELVMGSPYAIVIEADRILLMPREEAVALFKSWLETERR